MAILVQSNKKPSVSFPSQTGDIVTFNSQYAGLPLKSHTVALTATQSGSGTPSPDNVRTISGFDSVVITRCGKNLINLSDVYNSGYIYNKAPIFLKSGTYVLSVDISARGGQTLVLRKDNTEYFRLDFTSNIGRNVIIFTIPDEVNNFSLYSGVLATFADFQIEKGDTVSEFEAYNGNTYTFPFGQTVYGGEYDARTGVLTVTHGYIASYNGEVINEPWISSMDKYVEGGTPTSGAQVVYPLSTPRTIQLQPCPIDTLQGENNLFASAGETTASHIKIGG